MSEPQIVINTQTVAVEKPKTNACGLISLILACVALVFNPLYLLPIAAVILGVIGLIIGITKKAPIGTSIAGLILGVVFIGVQFLVDLIITLLTFGLGFFVFLI